MILEAFAEYLRDQDPEIHSRDVLAQWLLEKLSISPKSSVDKVLQLEIVICQKGEEPENQEPDEEAVYLEAPRKTSRNDSNLEEYVFKGSSKSGARLLKSLEEYSLSYENQKWARWVHQVKASDFNKKRNNS